MGALLTTCEWSCPGIATESGEKEWRELFLRMSCLLNYCETWKYNCLETGKPRVLLVLGNPGIRNKLNVVRHLFAQSTL